MLQTIRDGKSVIIEGMHIDPGLYLYEFGRYGLHHPQGPPRRGVGTVTRMSHPLTTRLADDNLSASDSDAFSPTDTRLDPPPPTSLLRIDLAPRVGGPSKFLLRAPVHISCQLFKRICLIQFRYLQPQ